jgi:hypothetical protein
MAISLTHYRITRDLFTFGVLPAGGAILEVGEANWYGDVDPLFMIEDIKRFVPDPVRRAALVKRLTDVVEAEPEFHLFAIAKIFYELYYAPSEVQAIDFNGTPTAQPLDLNGPITLNRRFNVVINHGTAEHVFNIAQVFKTIHEYTLPGGLMIHESPFTGWIDHGFFTLQPTLFYDLAEFNQYVLHAMVIANLVDQSVQQVDSREDLYDLAKAKKIPDNAMLFTILRKGDVEWPFRIPLQGYYRRALPESGMSAWNDLR